MEAAKEKFGYTGGEDSNSTYIPAPPSIPQIVIYPRLIPGGPYTAVYKDKNIRITRSSRLSINNAISHILEAIKGDTDIQGGYIWEG